MSLENKILKDVKISDLQNLINNEFEECKIIDYKEKLPGKSESERKEFLADVSSFANALGGHLIYGMKEVNSIPTEICGLEIDDPESPTLRFQEMILDGIRPRIFGVDIRFIPFQNNTYIIIIYIPRSWALPHMVTFNKDFRFYSRGPKGKYILEVTELRNLFSLSETTIEKIRNFRLERLSTIISEQTPIPLCKSGMFVLHMIPINAFSPSVQIDITELLSQRKEFYPLGLSFGDYSYTSDGFLSYVTRTQVENINSYALLFRNGIIESTNTLILHYPQGEKLIPSIRFENAIIEGTKSYLDFMRFLKVEPPILIMLSMLNVLGYRMSADGTYHVHEIQKDSLIMPEVLLEKFDGDISKILKSVFDVVWNACGYSRSQNYDDNGERINYN